MSQYNQGVLSSLSTVSALGISLPFHADLAHLGREVFTLTNQSNSYTECKVCQRIRDRWQCLGLWYEFVSVRIHVRPHCGWIVFEWVGYRSKRTALACNVCYACVQSWLLLRCAKVSRLRRPGILVCIVLRKVNSNHRVLLHGSHFQTSVLTKPVSDTEYMTRHGCIAVIVKLTTKFTFCSLDGILYRLRTVLISPVCKQIFSALIFHCWHSINESLPDWDIILFLHSLQCRA